MTAIPAFGYELDGESPTGEVAIYTVRIAEQGMSLGQVRRVTSGDYTRWYALPTYGGPVRKPCRSRTAASNLLYAANFPAAAPCGRGVDQNPNPDRRIR